jgi:D-amino peptidase
MKIYIGADIEGITGVTHWDEATKNNPGYMEFQEQMTAEVAGACEGALEADASEIWVKDAHRTARNLIASRLPKEVKLIRGWSEHPFSMVQDLDKSHDALLMIGYHSRAGSDMNPMAHTISGKTSSVQINNLYASEFLIPGYAAALKDVPPAFLSGDEGICTETKEFIPNIAAVAVKRGIGGSTINIYPQLAVEKIRDAVRKALQGDLSSCLIALPDHFHVKIRYRDHADAYHASFFPGAMLEEPYLLTFESEDYFEVLRLLSFVV